VQILVFDAVKFLIADAIITVKGLKNQRHMLAEFLLLNLAKFAACIVGQILSHSQHVLLAEDQVLKLYPRERRCRGVQEFEFVLHVVRSGKIATEDVEKQFAAFVTADESDEEALQSLLTVQHKALLFVVAGHIEVRQPCTVLRAEVVDELTPANLALCLPDEEGADGVFAEN